MLPRELVGPMDALHLVERLEQLQVSVFNKIPGLPPPSMIDHLLVVICQDLSATAYINELAVTAEVKITRSVKAGSPVFVGDIADIASIDLGVEVPLDAGVIVIRSMGWKRSLFFDFGPLGPGYKPRDFSLEQALAQQALLLLGLLPLPPLSTGTEDATGGTRLDYMTQGLHRLKELLSSKCEVESEYQELLEQHPWMFGGQYKTIERHTKLDDKGIPDFTAVRCSDSFRDIIEFKQPFLQCFRVGGAFASGFNDSWNQAERYLTFVNRQHSYLREEKNLRFENPRCLLVLGYDLTDPQLQKIRAKETLSLSIGVFTYDHLLKTAEHILDLMQSAGALVEPGIAG